jgi:hypothetical protein
MLSDSAAALGIPSTGGAHLFTDVSAADRSGLRRALDRAGVDQLTAQAWEPPEPAIPSAALPATAIGLALLLFGVVTATTWSSARDTRQLVSLLVALGVPPSAARKVPLLEHGYVLLVAVALGLVLAALPVGIARLASAQYQVAVPWTEALALGGGVLGAWLLSMLLALGRARGGIVSDAQ